MIRFPYTFFGGCPHDSAYREVRDGKLHLVCEDCGRAVPVGMGPVSEVLQQRLAEAKAQMRGPA